MFVGFEFFRKQNFSTNNKTFKITKVIDGHGVCSTNGEIIQILWLSKVSQPAAVVMSLANELTTIILLLLTFLLTPTITTTALDSKNHAANAMQQQQSMQLNALGEYTRIKKYMQLFICVYILTVTSIDL